jgi:methionine aminotransferase
MLKTTKNSPSIFSQMTQLAQEHGAINLAQGFPNMPIDSRLKECIAAAVRSEHHQYSPYQGMLDLRQEISKLIQRTSGVLVNPHEILITAGATQGIFTSVQALVGQGDEVVLLDPCYDCYELPVVLVGAKPVHVPLNEDYLPDWERIEAAMTQKTRLIVINSPHNPSGRVWEEQEYRELERILAKFPNLHILSDEVYEYLAFDRPHFSVRNTPFLSERSVVMASFGKSLQATGWKIGYLTAPEALMNRILQVHQFLVFSVNSFVQKGIADFLSEFSATEVNRDYRSRRARFSSGLEKSKFRLLPCEGTYFQTLDYSQISDENDVDFAIRLTQEAGVASIPISVFNHDRRDLKHLRFCFAKTEETLIEATERLCRI